MEEKKNKISLSVFISVLAVLVIIIMAGFIYMQKINADREIAGLKDDSEELKATVAELQGKLDNIGNIADTSNSKDYTLTEDNKKDIEYVIKQFYNLLGKKETESASMLVELGFTVEGVQDPDYNAPDGYVEYPNGEYAWTGIKYSDYLSAMNSYVSDTVLNDYFKDFVNYNGLLYMSGTMGPEVKYEIQSIELKESKNNECTYTVNVKKSNNNNAQIDEIILKRENSNFVINEVNNK